MKLITEQNFEQEISNGISIVLFGNDICAPCKLLGPVLEELTSKTSIKFFKYEIVRMSADILQQYEISGMPVVLIFVNGEVAERIEGRQEAEVYSDSISNLLNFLNSISYKEEVDE
jgi:thioredoxin 1